MLPFGKLEVQEKTCRKLVVFTKNDGIEADQTQIC